MKKVGLIAGKGFLPVEFVRAAKSRGERVVVFALEDHAEKILEQEADRVYWLNIGQYSKFALLLLKERIRNIALMGKVEKSIVYDKNVFEKTAAKSLQDLKKKKNFKDYSILEEVTRHLAKVGIQVINGNSYLEHLMPEKGRLGNIAPETSIEEDIAFGYETVKKLADMDIGQTVVVKQKSIVAVEAMEGTDATIERAFSVAGEGCVMVKVSRPNQDMRWDVPTVGPDTFKKLVENKFSALAIESGRMFLIDRPRCVEIADKNGIALTAL